MHATNPPTSSVFAIPNTPMLLFPSSNVQGASLSSMTKREQAKALLNGYFGAAAKEQADATVRVRERERGFFLSVGSVCIFSSVRQQD
jgi:hypothetical protein